MTRKLRVIRVETGSGNVFRDLGFPHAEREQIRADLTLQIYRLIKQRGLTQAEAAEILGTRQPHVSTLMRGRSGMFSVERLMQFLTALGQDVEITVRSARKPHGALSVVAVPKANSDKAVAREKDRHAVSMSRGRKTATPSPPSPRDGTGAPRAGHLARA
jgi:predicted XRE-type DNA-binding protein